jgi:Immunity protein 74
MFYEPRPNLAVSDEGFSVEILIGYDGGLIYNEGPRRMHLGTTVLVRPPGMMIYPYSIREWEPPYEDEPIDEAKREQIIARIRSAFDFWGLEMRVEETDLTYQGSWTDEDLDYFRKKGFKVYKLPDEGDSK